LAEDNVLRIGSSADLALNNINYLQHGTQIIVDTPQFNIHLNPDEQAWVTWRYDAEAGEVVVDSMLPIRIPNLIGGGGGGGITKLSELEIDADKDWNGKSITNFGSLSGSAIDISTDTGDITLNPASTYIRVPNGTLIGAINDSGEIFIVPNSIDWDAGVMIRGSTNPEYIPPYAALYCGNTGIDAEGEDYLVIYATPSGMRLVDGSPGAITINAEARVAINTPTLQFNALGGSGANTVFNSGGSQGFIFNSERSITLNATNNIVLNPSGETTTGKDIEITDNTKGVILKDRTTGTRYRLKVDNGTLGIEAVA
jgi:hypothetical protein